MYFQLDCNIKTHRNANINFYKKYHMLLNKEYTTSAWATFGSVQPINGRRPQRKLCTTINISGHDFLIIITHTLKQKRNKQIQS